MTENKIINNRPVVIAAATAIVIMFVFGMVNRVISARLAGEVVSPMSPDALDKLPLQIGDWTGQDEPLSEAIIEATGTDAHISRSYTKNNGLENVWLYIAAGRRARDLMPHRPEVCYIGAGWTRISTSSKELSMEKGNILPCRILQFSKGALAAQKVMVLDYYLIDGRFCQDVSLLRSKIWQGSGTVRYVVQIQVVASVATEHTTDSVEKMVCDFAVESAPKIFEVLESASNSKNYNTTRLNVEKGSGDANSD
jgi:EpsI family protein